MITWYLLFDSGCQVCSSLADAIREETQGQLIPRSLREKDVQDILDSTCPGWHFEPMLLAVDAVRNRVFTRMRMYQ